MVHSDKADRAKTAKTAKTATPATYALARGVPALQIEPSRVRALVLLSALLALLGGVVTGYVCSQRGALPTSASSWR